MINLNKMDYDVWLRQIVLFNSKCDAIGADMIHRLTQQSMNSRSVFALYPYETHVRSKLKNPATPTLR